MKKFFKVFFISLGSLILLIAIVVGIALWIVFTPDRLTPIVRSQAEKFITCETEINQVELTFFSTFPQFGLKTNKVALINPVGQANDTLLSVQNVKATIDIAALVKNNELIANDIQLSNGNIFAYIDSLGKTNFDIFPPSTEPEDTTKFQLPFGLIDVKSIELKNINITYLDEQSKMQAEIDGFSAKLNASVKSMDNIRANLELAPFDISFLDYASNIKADIQNFSGKLNGSLESDFIKLNANLSPFITSFEYENEPYLNKANIGLNIAADGTLSDQTINIKDLTLVVNNLSLMLKGMAGIDTLNNDIKTDLSYQLKSWNLKDIIALVPPAFTSYLEGIEAEGFLSSEGKITGIYNDSVMPLIDAHVLFENGKVNYPAMLPFPVSNILSDLSIYTDLNDDAISYVHINNLKANTPQSSLAANGTVKQLFSDMRINLSANADLNLNELKTFIPEDMPVDMKGNVKGNVRANFTLSQIEKMELDKIKASGSLALNNLDVVYDSISVKAANSNIDFALPNPKPSTRNTNFLQANINSNSLKASMIDSFDASLTNVLIGIETSDLRDTTQIPAIQLKINAENLNGGMDTLFVSMNNPFATLSISPQRRDAEKPRFKVSLKSDELRGNMGEMLKAEIEKMDVNATVVYNKEEEDVFLQWMPRGHVDIQQANISTTMLSYPIELPTIKMGFTPHEFTMEETSIKLGASDFKLSGKLENVLEYFRDTDYLQGEFNFVSNHTDIVQLMALTNGIGNDEKTPPTEKEPEKTGEEAYSGPYMVPRGMDIQLHVNIQEAGWINNTTINKMQGDVLVRDGLLFVDHLTFDTKGADMQLTAMYRTPRKNHLFAGVDFHMLNLEISELLKMIPDLDSIVPMLRSFDGKGEFHVVAETNFDSLYNIKISQTKGAVYINGQDLVLMDGEIFTKIAKMLHFNKKTENKVDSMAVTLTLFQDEIDVYPFMIVMDKYKVIVGGRHNLDMSMNYDITIYESPLPFRATLGITGDLDHMKFKIKRGRYIDAYRPVSRTVLGDKQKEFRKMVQQQLVKQVVTKKDEDEENTENTNTEQ